MSKIEKIKAVLEKMISEGQLPYVAKHWTVHEIKDTPPEKTCYSSSISTFNFSSIDLGNLKGTTRFNRYDSYPRKKVCFCGSLPIPQTDTPSDQRPVKNYIFSIWSQSQK